MNPLVIEGSDNYLFLTGGPHRPLAFLKGEIEPDASSIDNFWENLKRRQALCRQIGAAYVHLVSPDKAFVLRENFPVAIGTPILHRYIQGGGQSIYKQISPYISYPLDALKGEAQQVYSRVDSHFTLVGYLCCLEAALELAGKQELFDGKANEEAQALGSISGRGISAKAGNNLEVIAESSANLTSFGNAGIGDNGSSQALSSSIDLAMLRQWVMRNSIKQGVWSGDLGSKLHPPRKEARISFVPPHPIARFTNQLFAANDGICDIFINRSIIANSPRALVFGDSLARGLVPMMTRIFGIVLFCRSRYVHDEIALGFKPQFVISQNAERYLSKVSLDDERPPFLLYPSLRTEPVAVPNLFAKLMATCMAVDRPPFYRFIQQIQEGISIDSISF